MVVFVGGAFAAVKVVVNCCVIELEELAAAVAETVWFDAEIFAAEAVETAAVLTPEFAWATPVKLRVALSRPCPEECVAGAAVGDSAGA